MENILIIARRELKSYFISPIAYAVAFLILFILGIIFYSNIQFAYLQQFAPDIRSVLSPLVTLLLFTIPAITMRSFAEENRAGTLELLLTSPIRDWELILGKWLGGIGFFLMLLLITGIYPIILSQLVSPGLDLGIVLSSYLGILLVCAVFISIGNSVSSFFNNQIAAFFVTLAVLLALWMINILSSSSGNSESLLKWIDLSERFYGSFFQGVVSLTDLVYFISLTILGWLIGKVSLESRRWR